MDSSEIAKLLDRERKISAMLLDRSTGIGEKQAALVALEVVQRKLNDAGVSRTTVAPSPKERCGECHKLWDELWHSRLRVRSLDLALSDAQRQIMDLKAAPKAPKKPKVPKKVIIQAKYGGVCPVCAQRYLKDENISPTPESKWGHTKCIYPETKDASEAPL